MKTFTRSRWSLTIRSVMVVVAVVAVGLGYGLARQRWAAFRRQAVEEEAREIAERRSVQKLRKTVSQFAANAMEHARLADTDDADERGYRLEKVREMAEFIAWANAEIPVAQAAAEKHARAKKEWREKW